LKSTYLLVFFGCFAFSTIHAEPLHRAVQTDHNLLSVFWQKAVESNDFVSAFTDPILQLVTANGYVSVRPFAAEKEVEKSISLLVD
jgi:hypothetical protein